MALVEAPQTAALNRPLWKGCPGATLTISHYSIYQLNTECVNSYQLPAEIKNSQLPPTKQKKSTVKGALCQKVAHWVTHWILHGGWVLECLEAGTTKRENEAAFYSLLELKIILLQKDGPLLLEMSSKAPHSHSPKATSLIPTLFCMKLHLLPRWVCNSFILLSLIFTLDLENIQGKLIWKDQVLNPVFHDHCH